MRKLNSLSPTTTRPSPNYREKGAEYAAADRPISTLAIGKSGLRYAPMATGRSAGHAYVRRGGLGDRAIRIFYFHMAGSPIKAERDFRREKHYMAGRLARPAFFGYQKKTGDYDPGCDRRLRQIWIAIESAGDNGRRLGNAVSVQFYISRPDFVERGRRKFYLSHVRRKRSFHHPSLLLRFLWRKKTKMPRRRGCRRVLRNSRKKSRRHTPAPETRPAVAYPVLFVRTLFLGSGDGGRRRWAPPRQEGKRRPEGRALRGRKFLCRRNGNLVQGRPRRAR